MGEVSPKYLSLRRHTMSNLENAYREFNETDRNIFSTSGFYTSALAYFASEWGVSKDDLADYTAKQWGVYPYDE
jgi:hypothetical protein